MGNRAVITTKKNFENNGIGIYVHWNGGRDSVEGFLKYCELRKFRAPSEDSYGWAYLCGIISNFFGDGLSIGIDVVDNLDCDNGDNGVYLIDGWNIVGREYYSGIEQHDYSELQMLKSIDKRQPVEYQLGKLLDCKRVPVGELKIGDHVMVSTIHGQYDEFEVVGFGNDQYVNGSIRKNVPYINLYGFVNQDGTEDYSYNINNYLTEDAYYVVD